MEWSSIDATILGYGVKILNNSWRATRLSIGLHFCYRTNSVGRWLRRYDSVFFIWLLFVLIKSTKIICKMAYQSSCLSCCQLSVLLRHNQRQQCKKQQLLSRPKKGTTTMGIITMGGGLLYQQRTPAGKVVSDTILYQLIDNSTPLRKILVVVLAWDKNRWWREQNPRVAIKKPWLDAPHILFQRHSMMDENKIIDWQKRLGETLHILFIYHTTATIQPALAGLTTTFLV